MPNHPKLEEYDGAYFDGLFHDIRRSSGYTQYKNTPQLKAYAETIAASGYKKTLELGCAKGFVVEQLADSGIDAYGLDASDYALASANKEQADKAAILRRPDLAARFIAGDATKDLAVFEDLEFELLYSTKFLECLPEADVQAVVAEANRIAEKQIHIVGQYDGSPFYTQKTPEEWIASYDWKKGTIIASRADLSDGAEK